jgi:hypothetical protein
MLKHVVHTFTTLSERLKQKEVNRYVFHTHKSPFEFTFYQTC